MGGVSFLFVCLVWFFFFCKAASQDLMQILLV